MDKQSTGKALNFVYDKTPSLNLREVAKLSQLVVALCCNVLGPKTDSKNNRQMSVLSETKASHVKSYGGREV